MSVVSKRPTTTCRRSSGKAFLFGATIESCTTSSTKITCAWAIVLFIASAVVLGMGWLIARIPWVDRLLRKRQERKVQAALAMLPKREGD